MIYIKHTITMFRVFTSYYLFFLLLRRPFIQSCDASWMLGKKFIFHPNSILQQQETTSIPTVTVGSE